MNLVTQSKRVASIDILRGLVMIIMALDHVRDFFHTAGPNGDPLDLQTTTPQLFFTRWITHYCAPTFVFLSGLSAGLVSQRKTIGDTASFLIKRGLWLVIAEIVIVTLGWTFNPFYNFIVLQVIWAIGWSMVVLGLLLYIHPKIIFYAGILLIFGHDLLNYLPVSGNPSEDLLLKAAFTSNGVVLPLGGNHFLAVFYAILPWTGIMLMGFSLSKWYKMEYPPLVRKKNLLITGFSFVALFIILRLLNIYGDPVPRADQSTSFKSFLNFISASKYPPSLLYACMTIGPALIALALMENVRNRLTAVLSVYGKVPFFYYVLHIYLIHLLTVIVFYASGYSSGDIVPKNNPFLFRPDDFGYGLPVVYIVWLGVVALLYKPSKWFEGYKQRNKHKWWVSYL